MQMATHADVERILEIPSVKGLMNMPIRIIKVPRPVKMIPIIEWFIAEERMANNSETTMPAISNETELASPIIKISEGIRPEWDKILIIKKIIKAAIITIVW